MSKNLKIHDTVRVIAGDHKGEEAKIVRVDYKNHKAMLEGIGVSERNLKRTQYNPRGGKKTIHLGIDLSNLKLVEASEYVKAAVKKVDKADKKLDKEAKKAEKEANKKAKKGAK